MNLQEIARKHKVSENFLNSRDDAFDIAGASLEDLIFELKKGQIENETLIYQLQQLTNFLFDVRNSTF
jgi:hypothetical protein